MRRACLLHNNNITRMLEGKALIKNTDMPLKIQIQAMASVSQALDLYDVLDCKSIVANIKKEFDKRYGNGWQCVVGSNFGCFFTHTTGTFIYFKRLSTSSSSKGLLLHPHPLRDEHLVAKN